MTRGETIAFLLGLAAGITPMAILCWCLLHRVQRDLRRIISRLEKGEKGE